MADIELVIKISEAQKKMVDAIVELPPQVENDLISAIRHGKALIDISKSLAVLDDKAEILEQVDNAIEATDLKDEYSTGMRNGMRFVKYLIDGEKPIFEHMEVDDEN